jgi:hypothetical protein
VRGCAVKRWLLVLVGLAVGAAALYALVPEPGEDAPLDDIDAASRQQLERVLRESGDAR